MHHNKVTSAFLLTLIVIVTLSALHYLPTLQFGDYTLRRVNLLSDLHADITLTPTDTAGSVTLPPLPPAPRDTCPEGVTCIIDYADTSAHGMQPFYAAIRNKDYTKRPVRVAYFGDSFIEGDILTAPLRHMMQKAWGGSGVGFVPITSMTNGFRRSVIHRFEGWKSHSIHDSVGFRKRNMGLDAHYFIPRAQAWVMLGMSKQEREIHDTCLISEIYCNYRGKLTLRSNVDGGAPQQYAFTDSASTWRVLRCNAPIHQIRWTVEQADSAVFYGVTMDTPTGISLDNYSVRGTSGTYLSSVDPDIMHHMAQFRPYDLIILQYGLNVATRKGVDYDYYCKRMRHTIEVLKRYYPHAGFLLIGVGDRSVRDDDARWTTMQGVRYLLHYQQALAAEAHIAFWNLYEAMQSKGGMPEMVHQGMANYDYTHLNFKGGNLIARMLYESIMAGYKQYQNQCEYEKAVQERKAAIQ